MTDKTEREADTFVRKNITITGLEIARSAVDRFDARDITGRIGQKNDPFIITIPYNVSSIESVYDYWPVLCLRSSQSIGKVAARAILERNPPTNQDNLEPCDLTDQDGSVQIPFPGSPDAPHNFYHRWWRWPKGPAWREPANYLLKIWLGYNKYKPFPDPPTEKSDADWISQPVTYKIQIKNEKPPKKEKKPE